MSLKQSLTPSVLIALLSISYAATYHVGPGMDYQNIGDVPLDSITAGDSVKIEYREEPYREKWVISAPGTEQNPVVFSGIVSQNGALPVIDGDGAATSEDLDFWSETRGIIKIGGSSTPGDSASWITVENLEIRNARPGFYFTDDAGSEQEYSSNASAVYVEKGNNITFRNCVFHDCGNGFFASYQSSSILVEGCYYYDNGIEGSIYEHNNYTESNGITFQFNRFGHLREGCPGNNLKDRSAGTVIRYNWIQGGNRQLDLVDAGHSEITGRDSYSETYVYGNILIEDENSGNSQICHYGGDSEEYENYRQGVLWFYYNSVISLRDGRMTLLRLSTDNESANVINNVIYSSSGGGNTAILDAAGSVQMLNNWIGEGWRESFSAGSFDITDEGTITGAQPGFSNPEELDFRPEDGSALIGSASPLPAELPEAYIPDMQYLKHRDSTSRSIDENSDIGALSNNVNSYINYISENNIQNKIILKNVPGEDYFKVYIDNLRCSNLTFRLLDLKGKVIFQKEIKLMATDLVEKNCFKINLQHLSRGLYLLKINRDKSASVERIFIF